MALKQFSPYTVVNLFGSSVASSSYAESEAISGVGLDGYFSLQWTITGDGTAKFEVFSSNNGTDFMDVNADIITGQTKTTGPSGDGKNMTSFVIIPCVMFKIRVTETGGASAIVPSAWLKAY